jgi:lysozyme
VPATVPASTTRTVTVLIRRSATAGAALLATLALALAAPASAVANPYGPDVASYQHPTSHRYPKGAPIKWNSVAAEPDQHFAIIKATQGTNYVNPYLASDAGNARAAGLVVGFYHFADPGQSPVAQANFFARTIGRVRAGELAPILDLEITGQCGKKHRACTPKHIVSWTRSFLTRLKADTHRTPMIYTDPGFWNSSVRSRAFSSYPLWLADFTYDPAGSPDAWPMGWTRYALWQYTDDATIPGIVGATDRSTSPGAFALDRLSHAGPDRFFLDAVALDIHGALLADPTEAALDADLDAGKLSRATVATRLLATTTALRREVRAAYAQVLDNRAVPGARLSADIAELAHGMTPAGLLAQLAATPRFAAQAGGTAAGFVTLLYTRLVGHPVSAATLAADERLLAAGATHLQLATAVLSSAPGRASQVSRVFEQVLRRAAGAAAIATYSRVLAANDDDVTPVLADLYASRDYLQTVALAGK